MRNWIQLVENTQEWQNEHPHREGHDEWFNHGFGLFQTNVDAIKRKIASGEITPLRHTYSVKNMVERIYPSVDHADFGSKNFQDENSFDLMGPPITKSRMAHIPAEKMSEPVLFIMWNSVHAMQMIGIDHTDDAGKEYPAIVDGNHRLMRRYLEGDTGNVEAEFVPFMDALKHTMHRGHLLSELVSSNP